MKLRKIYIPYSICKENSKVLKNIKVDLIRISSNERRMIIKDLVKKFERKNICFIFSIINEIINLEKILENENDSKS